MYANLLMFLGKQKEKEKRYRKKSPKGTTENGRTIQRCKYRQF